jgi:putative glutamine amidotransferase
VNRPRIAIPEPTSNDAAYNQRSLPQYINALEATGATAVLVPLHESLSSQEGVLATCTGVLLPGSPADVDPARYGQEAHKNCAPNDLLREQTDNLLLHNAFKCKKPVLGICFGLQSLNVWRHGTLIQDLPSQLASGSPEFPAYVNHEPGREVNEAHPIVVTSGSRLFGLAMCAEPEKQQVFVNSSHHQAIDHPGDGLSISAVSPVDKTIEALEGSDPGQFVVAVQWHPERTYGSSEISRALFNAFVDAARSWQHSKT